MKIEKGKWYHADGVLIYVNKLHKDTVFGYGLNSEEGFWIEEDDDPWYVMQITHEATPQEVIEALTKEAKRRYKIGDKVKDVNGVEIVPNGSYVFIDGVLYYGGATLMKDGKWAEVIKNDDKFAELKEAHKNGAVIECLQTARNSNIWVEIENPQWQIECEYRIKPISKEEQKELIVELSNSESYDDPYSWVNNSMKEDKPQMFSGGMNKDNREDEEILRRAKEGVSDFYTITESIADLLVYKNAKYGNAVLEPLQIFSGKCKAGTRLDDKLGRIKNSSELRKNDVADLIGYLILTCKENNWTDFSEFKD